MFELGTIEHWWEVAKRYPILSNHNQVLKALGYAHMIMLIEAFKPQKVLEIGHGAGSFLFNTFTSNIEFWGLDDTIENSKVSKDDLELFKKWNPQVKFVIGLLGNNIKELPDNYFDLVCSVSVIEHIDNEKLSDVFAETYRILKPGGIVSHSFDIYYNQDTKPVFDAYEQNGFEWLKSRERMNVFWEEWLNNFDSLDLKELFEKIVFENPMVVAETYMWQIERNKRSSPINYLTVLNAARKPLNNLEANKSDTNNVVANTNLNNSDILSDISPENFYEFTYSKKRHLDFFSDKKFDEELLHYKVEPGYCDIKTYQDLLIYSFLVNNIKKESKVLQLGGNYPAILIKTKKDYECWNLIKSDESFIYLTESHKEGINFKSGEIGNSGNKLPDNYFDFVFSSSDFGYDASSEPSGLEKISNDINRILKPGGYCLLCIVALWKEPTIWAPDILTYLFNNQETKNKFIPYFIITLDENLYFMSEKFYSDNWQQFTGKTYRKFGKPLSYNIIWRK